MDDDWRWTEADGTVGDGSITSSGVKKAVHDDDDDTTIAIDFVSQSIFLKYIKPLCSLSLGLSHFKNYSAVVNFNKK